MSIYYIDEKSPLLVESEKEIDKKDPSLNGEMANSFLSEFRLNVEDFNRLFFLKYEMEYISRYSYLNHLDLRVVTHPYETNTCFEKAELFGSWDPLNVIKALYFEYSVDSSLYAVVVPETGCFINRARLKEILELPGGGFLKKANVLPQYMSFGTCSPFITEKDLKVNGGRIEKIIFDSEALEVKKEENTLDDFSFGLDHRMSLQMNYYTCFEMLKKRYPNTVIEREVLNLSFNEKLIRNNGKINISYEFQSLNYRTAKFINSIHGYGDVTILNDYLDELNLPRILNGTHKANS
ncbi:MAG: hypothetical protein HY282_17805 [Nitrospirae bacterium]|nr:hypothetical protein [Candidatus Manganitrophaceae bacterium]